MSKVYISQAPKHCNKVYLHTLFELVSSLSSQLGHFSWLISGLQSQQGILGYLLLKRLKDHLIKVFYCLCSSWFLKEPVQFFLFKWHSSNILWPVAWPFPWQHTVKGENPSLFDRSRLICFSGKYLLVLLIQLCHHHYGERKVQQYSTETFSRFDFLSLLAGVNRLSCN